MPSSPQNVEISEEKFHPSDFAKRAEGDIRSYDREVYFYILKAANRRTLVNRFFAEIEAYQENTPETDDELFLAFCEIYFSIDEQASDLRNRIEATINSIRFKPLRLEEPESLQTLFLVIYGIKLIPFIFSKESRLSIAYLQNYTAKVILDFLNNPRKLGLAVYGLFEMSSNIVNRFSNQLSSFWNYISSGTNNAVEVEVKEKAKETKEEAKEEAKEEKGNSHDVSQSTQENNQNSYSPYDKDYLETRSKFGFTLRVLLLDLIDKQKLAALDQENIFDFAIASANETISILKKRSSEEKSEEKAGPQDQDIIKKAIKTSMVIVGQNRKQDIFREEISQDIFREEVKEEVSGKRKRSDSDFMEAKDQNEEKERPEDTRSKSRRLAY
jgi:hypothetical protein